MSELRTDSREWVHRIMGSLDRMLVGIENLAEQICLSIIKNILKTIRYNKYTRVRDKKKQEANMKKIGNLAGILYIYG